MRSQHLALAGLSALSFVAVAVVPEWNGLEDHLPGIGSGGGTHLKTERYVMSRFGVENISIFGSPPSNNNPLFRDDSVDDLLRHGNGGHLERTVGADNVVGGVDLVEWPCEINIVGNVPLEETNGIPRGESGCSGAAKILKIAKKAIKYGLPVLIIGNQNSSTGESDDRPQLRPRVHLSVIRDTPLLIDKKIGRDVGEEQEASKPRNGLRPFDHIAFNLAWGVLYLLAGGWIGLRCIFHAIFSPRPYSWVAYGGGLTIAATALVLGLAALFP